MNEFTSTNELLTTSPFAFAMEIIWSVIADLLLEELQEEDETNEEEQQQVELVEEEEEVVAIVVAMGLRWSFESLQRDLRFVPQPLVDAGMEEQTDDPMELLLLLLLPIWRLEDSHFGADMYPTKEWHKYKWMTKFLSMNQITNYAAAAAVVVVFENNTTTCRNKETL